MIITGEINNIIFENKENNYYILNVIDEAGERYTICGYLLKPELDITYDFTVREVNHPKYGLQYQVLSYQMHHEKSREGIISYLSSNLFPKVGLVSAMAIYEKLGDTALEDIEANPDVLDSIVSQTQKAIIYQKLLENRAVEKLFVALYDYGLTSKMILKLYEKYHDKTLTVIKENPYQLIYDLDGFGFKKADDLAFKLGFMPNNIERLKALLIFTLLQTAQSYGLTYLTVEQLFNSSYQFGLKNTNLDLNVLEPALEAVVKSGRIVKIMDRVYLREFNEAEANIARRLKLIKDNTQPTYKKNLFTSLLDDFQNINQITFSSDQIDAIINALNNRVSIITGGPGTGKTTIIKAIIAIYAGLHGYDLFSDSIVSKILLCAPTGKASKRMSEKTNFTAKTIHKALGYNFENEFSFNEDNLLPQHLIVIDETSMIDTFLASHLLSAISVNAQVIFVGDVFQLPSVAPGAFLRDLIASNAFKTTYLKTIYRQEAGSNIIKLAELTKDGFFDENLFKLGSDIEYIYASNLNLVDKTLEVIKDLIANGESLRDDIMVLAPMYKGIVGIDNLNQAISKTFNTSYRYEINRKGLVFRENDKVIELTNSKDYEIMNGDLGYLGEKLLAIVNDKEKEVYKVDFDYHTVKLTEPDFENLNLAYAISVHKSQGSEFKTVILPMSYSYGIMLKRKLLYTAITRAKEKLIIIGDLNAFKKGLEGIEANRQTSLTLRLLDDTNEIIKINDAEIPFDTLGEYDMEGITPYTFME